MILVGFFASMPVSAQGLPWARSWDGGAWDPARALYEEIHGAREARPRSHAANWNSYGRSARQGDDWDELDLDGMLAEACEDPANVDALPGGACDAPFSEHTPSMQQTLTQWACQIPEVAAELPACNGRSARYSRSARQSESSVLTSESALEMACDDPEMRDALPEGACDAPFSELNPSMQQTLLDGACKIDEVAAVLPACNGRSTRYTRSTRYSRSTRYTR